MKTNSILKAVIFFSLLSRSSFAEEINILQMQTMLKNKISVYQQAKQYNMWENIPTNLNINLLESSPYVSDIKNHLAINGEYKNYNDQTVNFSEELSIALKRYQENNSLNPTGLLNKETIQSLNKPMSSTIFELSKNLERLNTYSFSGNYILINIPFYNLDIVYEDKIAYQMSVIVGKSRTQSCTLDSKITSIVFNPSWYVPKSIARSEMIPKLYKNPSYFEKHNIHILNSEKDDISVDDAINEDSSNLKFVQYPGNNNALGKVKFIFQNDCGIYLHDTNQRNLFTKDTKGLSHGCIRLSNPDLLAKYLLFYNDFNESQINNYLSLKNTKTVNLNKSFDIHIIYLNSYVNSNNEIVSTKDIYNKNK